MTPFVLLKYFISVHKYPRYFVDKFFVPLILAFIWRRQGVIMGRGIVWSGVPIVALTPQSKIQIGKRCVFCSRSRRTALGINHSMVLRTLRSEAELKIGDGCRMSGTTLCAAKRVVVGKRCVIGANVTIVDTDFHSLDPWTRSSPQDALDAKVAPVLIGNDVFIGGGSFILKGVNIGDGTVIGAGSVVTKSFPPRSIIAGNPACQVATLDNIKP